MHTAAGAKLGGVARRAGQADLGEQGQAFGGGLLHDMVRPVQDGLAQVRGAGFGVHRRDFH